MLRQAQDQSVIVRETANCENCTDFFSTLAALDNEDKEPAYLSVFHTVFLATIILMSGVGNGLVSLVLIRKRSLSPSSRLVLSLCCSNLLLTCGVLSLSFVASVLEKWPFGLPWCWASAFLVQLVGCASNLTLAAIAIDRYFAIVTPMTYSVRINSAKSTILLLAIWLFALISSLPPFFGSLGLDYQPTHYTCLILWEDTPIYTSTVFLLNTVIPLFIMSVSYGRIFQIARSKYKTTNIGTISAVVRLEMQEPYCRQQIGNIRHLQRHYVRKPSWLSIVLQSPVKGFAVICCILGVYCLCWTPYVVTLILVFCRISLTVWQRRIAFVFALLSVPSYPVIYGLLNRSIRKDLFRWMRPRKQKKSQGRCLTPSGLLDYVPPFSHLQLACQATTAPPLQQTAKVASITEKQPRKTSEDSGHYSLPCDDTDADSCLGSQLSGIAKMSCQDSVDSRRKSSIMTLNSGVPFNPLSTSSEKKI